MIPFQEPDLEERFAGVSRDRCRDELHLIDEQNHIFTGAEAIRETLRRLPRAPIFTFPFRLPGAMILAGWTYRWVARNRAWLSQWLDSTTGDR